MTDNNTIARNILDAIGGKENVISASHCMTRLRLNLKDLSRASEEEIRNVAGVMGTQIVGDQLQVIIGNKVASIYGPFCDLAGIAQKAVIEENLDKEKITWRTAPKMVLQAVVDCLTPLIPVLITAGLVKMIVALIGPSMLNLVSETSNLYTLLNFVGDAGFYFFPVFVAYTAAKRFNCSILMALLLAGIMIHPTLIGIVNSGEPFSVYGIPMTPVTYSSTVFPVMLSVWIMSYVEKFFTRVIPDMVKSMLVPLCTILVMLPIALCIAGPLGSFIGSFVGSVLVWLHDTFGAFGVGVIAALMFPVVATGMHLALFTSAIVSLTTLGYDSAVFVGTTVGCYCSIAISLATMIKAKDKNLKSLALTTLASQALGGVGEPMMFGIMFRYTKALINLSIGSFCGGFVAGLLKAKVYLPASSNFLCALGFASANDPSNMIRGIIGCAVGFAVTFILTMITGVEDDGRSLFRKKPA